MRIDLGIRKKNDISFIWQIEVEAIFSLNPDFAPAQPPPSNRDIQSSKVGTPLII